MQQAQDVDLRRTCPDTIDRDEGCPRDHQFPCAAPAARAAEFGEMGKTVGRSLDAITLLDRCPHIVGCDTSELRSALGESLG